MLSSPSRLGQSRDRVIGLAGPLRGERGASATSARFPSAAAFLVAVVVACSPLASGYYDFGAWSPLAIGAVVILFVLALSSRAALTRSGISASTALIALLLLSFASMLWASSREGAWTDSNRLALYVVIFGIALLGIRDRRSAASILVVLGMPALVTSVVIAFEMAAGVAQGAFLQGRLDSPMGYINGTAGLLVMGIWPWMALAERATRRIARSAAFSASSLIAATAVLTQSRAVVPALVVATTLAILAEPRRVRRVVHVVLLLLTVAVSLHWTLAIYRATGPTQTLPIAAHTFRAAGLTVLLGGVLGSIAHYVTDLGASAVPASARRKVRNTLGVLLFVAILGGGVGAVLVGHSKIARQWQAFTALKVNQAAPNRFLDAGGFRYDLWRIAVDEFKAHPLSGVGAGNYDVDYYRLRDNPQSVIQPHSLELQMAAELGIGGLLALLVFSGTVLVAALRGTRTTASRDPMIRIAALGIFSAWFTATSVDWLYDIPGLTMMALIAAAAVLVPSESRNGHSSEPVSSAAEPERPVRQRRIALPIVVALAIVVASIGRQYAASRFEARGAAEVSRHPVSAIFTLETAESLDPYSLDTLYSIASAYSRLNDYAGARAALLDAARREPLNYVPPALLGDLATRHGDARVARSEYLRALRLNPRESALLAAVTSSSRSAPR